MAGRSRLLVRVQGRIFAALANDLSGGSLHRAVSSFLIALISLNVLAVVLQTVQDVESQCRHLFHAFEVFSVVVFTLEYLLRLWVCPLDPRYHQRLVGRLRYALTPLALTDLLAFLPFYFPLVLPLDLRFLRAVRLLRLVRLLKVGRYSESSTRVWRVVRAKRHELLTVLYCLLTVLVMASSAMYYAEHEAQPRAFASIPASMWWALVTLTTVGYGDIYPVTPTGKLLAGLVSIVGIAIFALPAGIIASGFAEEHAAPRAQTVVCPHCGKEHEVAETPAVV